jgi:hypothetical protein
MIYGTSLRVERPFRYGISREFDPEAPWRFSPPASPHIQMEDKIKKYKRDILSAQRRMAKLMGYRIVSVANRGFPVGRDLSADMAEAIFLFVIECRKRNVPLYVAGGWLGAYKTPSSFRVKWISYYTKSIRPILVLTKGMSFVNKARFESYEIQAKKAINKDVSLWSRQYEKPVLR